MDVKGQKIQDLISYYGKTNGIPEKSYLVKFTEDFKLNYKQWSAYTRGDQNLGIKIIDVLMDIFPKLNLNWLLKDEGDMFLNDNSEVVYSEKSERKVTNEMLFSKLETMHKDILQGIKK